MAQNEKAFYEICEKILDEQERTIKHMKESIAKTQSLIDELQETFEQTNNAKR
ncbi:MAG: hypothetical protein KBT34_05480 [Prevotella sp.]|nr:hypothetical protein [Candidatus Prevotella equi]